MAVVSITPVFVIYAFRAALQARAPDEELHDGRTPSPRDAALARMVRRGAERAACEMK
jgi:hypothetical protein